MEFDGKVAIVTGGSTGLGAIAELFKRSARVVIAARHEEQARVVGDDGLDPTGKRVYGEQMLEIPALSEPDRPPGTLRCIAPRRQYCKVLQDLEASHNPRL